MSVSAVDLYTQISETEIKYHVCQEISTLSVPHTCVLTVWSFPTTGPMKEYSTEHTGA